MKNILAFAGRRQHRVDRSAQSTARLCQLWLLGGALAVVHAGSAASQERTTATYDDWTLQCELQPGPPKRRICSVWQMAQSQGHPVSRLEIGRPLQGQAVRLVAQVPVNVLLRGGVRLQASNADPGLQAPFDRCLPAGCFAALDLTADALRKFRSSGAGAKLTFVNAMGQPVSVPVSFKGFAAAFDALAKQ